MGKIRKVTHAVGWRLRYVLGTIYKCYTRKYLYPKAYRRCCEAPVEEDKILFLEVRMPQLTDNFRLLYDRLEQEGSYRLVFASLGDGLERRTQVQRNSLAALKEIATAKYVFINDSCGLIGCLDLRPQTKVIQVWHACGAFKKFGYSTIDKIFGATAKELERFPLHRNFSMVTVSSPEVVWAYAEAFHMEDRVADIVPAGISRTDVFYQPERILAAHEKLYEKLPQCRGKKIILYAPTFRGRVAEAVSPDRLDFERLRQALSDEYVVVCKHHPFVKKRPQIPQSCREFAVDVTEEMEIEELLMVSDLCISDYSSLIFEYSLFEKPMIFFAYDLDDYFDWRGFYYDYYELAPGPVLRTTEEIVEYISHIEERFDRQQVAEFRRKFMSACDGQATQRILEMAGIVRGEDGR